MLKCDNQKQKGEKKSERKIDVSERKQDAPKTFDHYCRRIPLGGILTWAKTQTEFKVALGQSNLNPWDSFRTECGFKVD